MLNGEEWRPVLGFEGIYEVSSVGRVKSLERLVAGKYGARHISARIMKPAPDRAGYPSVVLSDGRGGHFGRKVHRLVLEAFVGPRPFRLAVARHLNGTPDDNRRENLAWGTYSENAGDAREHGTLLCGARLSSITRGSGNGRARLNDQAVVVIRHMRGRVTPTLLAAVYGVSPTAISRVQLYRTWARVA